MNVTKTHKRSSGIVIISRAKKLSKQKGLSIKKCFYVFNLKLDGIIVIKLQLQDLEPLPYHISHLVTAKVVDVVQTTVLRNYF